MAVVADPSTVAAGVREGNPIARLVRRRLAFGVLTLFLVSVVVFVATEVLPGNAAFAILGRNANPVRVRATLPITKDGNTIALLAWFDRTAG